MNKLATIATGLILCLGGGASAAAATSVAVLGVESIDSPPDMATLLTTALEDRVRATEGFNAIPGKDLDEIKLVFGCVEGKPECMARVGKSLKADKLIWGSVKKTAAGYNVTIKWLDVAQERIEKFVSENIGSMALDQEGANRIIARLTQSFLVSPYGTIKITAKVSGAQVMLGPRIIGLTDKGAVVLRDVPAGTHLVRISKEGYRPWTQQVIVRGGETSELEADLEQIAAEEEYVPPPPPVIVEPAKAPSRGGWKAAFWTGAALTVALAGTMGYVGYTVLGLAEDKEDAIGEFRTKYNRPTAFSSDDACAEVDDFPEAKQVKSICDKGNNRALMTNVLIGGTLAVAALSGFFYYKAYIADESTSKKRIDEDEDDVNTVSAPVRWGLIPTAGENGAGLDFTLNF